MPRQNAVITAPVYLNQGQTVRLATGGTFSKVAGLPPGVTSQVQPLYSPYYDLYELDLVAPEDVASGTSTLTYIVTPPAIDPPPQPDNKTRWPYPKPIHYQTQLVVGLTVAGTADQLNPYSLNTDGVDDIELLQPLWNDNSGFDNPTESVDPSKKLVLVL